MTTCLTLYILLINYFKVTYPPHMLLRNRSGTVHELYKAGVGREAEDRLGYYSDRRQRFIRSVGLHLPQEEVEERADHRQGGKQSEEGTETHIMHAGVQSSQLSLKDVASEKY